MSAFHLSKLNWARDLQGSLDLYDCLEVASDASYAEIEAAYAAALKKLPSHGIRGWIVAKLGFSYPYDYAFRVLSDPKSRREYDANPGAHSKITLHYHGF